MSRYIHNQIVKVINNPTSQIVDQEHPIPVDLWTLNSKGYNLYYTLIFDSNCIIKNHYYEFNFFSRFANRSYELQFNDEQFVQDIKKRFYALINFVLEVPVCFMFDGNKQYFYLLGKIHEQYFQVLDNFIIGRSDKSLDQLLNTWGKIVNSGESIKNGIFYLNDKSINEVIFSKDVTDALLTTYNRFKKFAKPVVIKELLI